ncbi:lipid-A-disaccharide synthase [Pseudoroseicyclus tamaricis]|uniref:Lipid-A-disaccharide synthase n=1 Tax=Pseudoroseicyclus tamaricis TaxID=2705421 RepID=A0A6B2JWL4_9RHOB|nr:lipid-A-disaccharide synthase [Pseudoroseicyclus tamaricis]NDV00614.1 lipid-A-disaccharide synthase [Pseudoroseicyclus tamaricis]
MKIFVIAGEPSGDALGASVMAGLRQLAPGVTFAGIGGPGMEGQGLQSRFPMDELSLMGLAEILPNYLSLRRRLSEAVEAVLADPPDLLLTIDAPEFCLRVAKGVKARAPQIRTSHYVAPSVWAWRPGRARKMAQYIDHVLALLPFEPPYMREAGMACDFVGHPVVTMPVATEQEATAYRERAEIGAAPLILALPGSRRTEVTRLMDRFGETLHRVRGIRPEAKVVVPMAAPVVPLVREAAARWPFEPIFIDPTFDRGGRDKSAAFRAADIALAASGTVSLELAANATPMVIGYDMAWASRQIVSRLLVTDSVNLVNLVSDSRAIPEFIGANCHPDLMADALMTALEEPARQRAAMETCMDRLGRGGPPPGLRAAEALLARLTPPAGQP